MYALTGSLGETVTGAVSPPPLTVSLGADSASATIGIVTCPERSVVNVTGVLDKVTLWPFSSAIAGADDVTWSDLAATRVPQSSARVSCTRYVLTSAGSVAGRWIWLAFQPPSDRLISTSRLPSLSITTNSSLADARVWLLTPASPPWRGTAGL